VRPSSLSTSLPFLPLSPSSTPSLFFRRLAYTSWHLARRYNDISLWDWSKVLPLFTPPATSASSPVKPGRSFSASTRGELEAILADDDFIAADRVQMLEVKCGRLDAPKALFKLGEVVRPLPSLL